MARETKTTFAGTSIQNYPERCEATMGWFVDFTDEFPNGQTDLSPEVRGTGGSPPFDPAGTAAKIIIKAINDGVIPSIGDEPLDPVLGANGKYHMLRVNGHRIEPLSAFKVRCEVLLQSRLKATLQFDANASQSSVGTYLLATDSGEPFGGGIAEIAPARSQMTLNWERKQGSYATINGTPYPTEDFEFPTLPVEGQALRFGATVSMAATYFSDEMQGDAPQNPNDTSLDVAVAERVALRIAGYYTDTVNADDLIFVGDAGYWIITSCRVTSTDGGYSYRISVEWMFNPDGWDTFSLYHDPMTGSDAVIDQESLKTYLLPLLLSKQKGAGVNGSVPAPLVVDLEGAGRWPQSRQVPHSALRSAVAQRESADPAKTKQYMTDVRTQLDSSSLLASTPSSYT